MIRVSRLVLIVPIVAAATLTLSAQQAPKALPLYLNKPPIPFIPFVPAVPGVPLTATLAIREDSPLGQTSAGELRSIARVTRDSSGQTFHEQRAVEPASSIEKPPLIHEILFDPGTRIIQAVDFPSRVVNWSRLPTATNASAHATGGETEDLGTKTIDGYTVKGTRHTARIPAEHSPTGRPELIVHESWFSDELQMNVLERRTGPGGRVEEIEISDVDRNEPSAARFKIPRGFEVREQGKPVVSKTAGVTPFNPCAIPSVSYDPNDPNSSPGCTAGFSEGLPR